jgi:hypothetical protein
LTGLQSFVPPPDAVVPGAAVVPLDEPPLLPQAAKTRPAAAKLTTRVRVGERMVLLSVGFAGS